MFKFNTSIEFRAGPSTQKGKNEIHSSEQKAYKQMWVRSQYKLYWLQFKLNAIS